jgi:hypothetical protein
VSDEGGTVYLFFQLFALYRSRRTAGPPRVIGPGARALDAWWPALAMYAATAMRPVMTLLFSPSGPATVTDPGGVVWNVAALYGVVALAGIFTMGAFALLALLRLVERALPATGATPEQ